MPLSLLCRTSPIALSAALFLIVTQASAQAPTDAPPAGETADADAQPPSPGGAVVGDALYRQGIDAFKEGKLDEAYKLLSQAWAAKQSVDIAANLGVVELKLDKPRDAAEHLDYALRLYPVGGDPEARAVLEQRYQEARQKVGAVRVACDGKGAEVAVDGRELGKAPISVEKFIDPGKRKFTAVLDGFENGEMTVRIEPGSEITIEIKMGPKKPAGDRPGHRVEHAEKPIWPIFVFAGVGAVGLGSGIGLMVMSSSAKGDLEDSGCRSQGCAGQYQDQVDSYNLGRNAGVPLLAVGGLSLAGMIVYLAWPSPDEEDPHDGHKQATWVLPMLGTDGGGLTVGGEF